MKNLKITDFRIPLTLFLSIFLFALPGILINNEVINVIFGILTITSVILFLLVYFPLLTIKIAKGKVENKDNVVNAIGVFCISLIVLGIVFKLFRLPGAGVIIIVGCSCFSINFLPSWFFSNYKENTKFQRILNFFFSTCLGILILAYEFKAMHWPGGNFMLDLAYYSSLLILLPASIYVLILKRKEKIISFPNFFLFGFIIAFIISGILSTKLANRSFVSDNKTQLGIESNIKMYETKNKFLYDAFKNNTNNDSLIVNYKLKVDKLKKISEDTYTHIKDLKNYLVIKSDNLSITEKDSISFDNIISKTNSDIPTMILIGSDKNPNTDNYSASTIKSKLETYFLQLSELVPKEYEIQFKECNPFDFNDVQIDVNWEEPWIIATFYNEPLANVYTTLTGLQANVRYLEMTVLNELFNKANSSNKDNIAGQLAELAVKYESEKQAKQIAVLQKDQEMNDLKIQAKDAEISERENTITLFIFGGIIVGVLLIFVVRSNVLRKQANKELAKQKDVIASQKDEVENQKHLIEEKQKEILDSIHYAKRLQEAILPPLKFIDEHVPNNFVLYQPKDVVAGDFYWAETKDNKFFIAAADCTGHGVPGAMVSVVCSNALNRTVNEFGITDTGKILDKTRELVLETFAKGNAEVKDGMDISLLCIDKQNNKAFWSGANNPLWYVQSSVTSSEVEKSTDASLDSARPDIQLIEIKADKQPIGKSDYAKPFTTHEIVLQEGMLFYLFTDGFADQFGGPKGKKFKYKQLEELLLANANKNMHEQNNALTQQFSLWKGDLEQVDDVCVIGVKI